MNVAQFARFLNAQMRSYRLYLVASTAAGVVFVTAEVLTAFPLKFILDKTVDHLDPGWPWNQGISMFDGLGSRNGLQPAEAHTLVGVIAFSAALIVMLGLVGALASHAQLYMAAMVGQNVSARMRRSAFEHVLRLPLDWHGRKKSGDLVQRLTGNVSDIEKLMIDGLIDLLTGILTLVGMVAVLFLLNWRFTLLSVVIVPALFAIVLHYTRHIKSATKSAARAAGQVSAVATEDIRAISEVKAFTLEERETVNFHRHVQRYRDNALRAGRLQAEFRPIVAFVLAISMFTVVGVGAFVATGHTFSLWLLTLPASTLTLGTLTVFIHYLKQLYQPMRDLSKLMYLATYATSAAERIHEILEQTPEVVDRTPAVTAPRVTSSTRCLHVPSRLQGALRYEGVVFGYLAGQPVIKGVDLAIEAGKKVALVGLSGSGKTTLVKLIPRFHDVWEGRILVDGRSSDQYPLNVLRQNISFVLQDSVLFEGTIRDNIALGRPDVSDRRVIDAARKAQIHETIVSLPGGYGAYVREQGKNLSTGQRQRLAIARAIVRDTPILILDEPTASLDVEAEGEVMRALNTAIDGRTVITISHRLSTLGQVDEIAVLEGGVIVERGDFLTLKDAGGMFAWLLEEQRRFGPETVIQSSGAGPALRIALDH